MPVAEPVADPRAPLGHLVRLGSALTEAPDVDAIAASLLLDLAALPGVRRVGVALVEGGGRRLHFTASDRDHSAGLDWCHIDAYDDVPLTTVVRTGEAVLGDRASVSRQYAVHVAAQPEQVRAIAAVPLPGDSSPIGGIVLYLDEVWPFDEAQRRLLDATARRTSEAIRRVRTGALTPAKARPDAELDPGSSVTTSLEDHPSSAGVARRFLREVLEGWGVRADVAETALLCLSELVTNAFMHAGGSSELRANVDGRRLRVSVRDAGAAGEPDPVVPDSDADPLRVHGRGLRLVEALADAWGSERDVVGTTVWFTLDL